MSDDEILASLLGGYAAVSKFGITLDGEIEWIDLPDFIRELQRILRENVIEPVIEESEAEWGER